MKSKRSKRFIIGLVLAIVGGLGFLGSFGITEGKAAGFVGSIILIAVGALLLYLDSRNKEATPQETKNIVRPSPVSSSKTASVPESEKNYDLFDDVFNSGVLRYQYEENICLQDGLINSISGNGGKSLEFVQEPENEYDSKAIAIYLNGVKIGYVYKGKVQDMLNDWIKRGDTYRGYVNKIDVPGGKVTYKIGFYKALSSFEYKTFPLTKTGKKIDSDTKREDNLLGCNVGDDVIIEFSDDYDNFVVYNGSYEEIGELSAGARSFIENGDYKKLVGLIEQLEYDENDKPKIKIAVYLVS